MAVICNTCGLPEDLCACGELAKDSTKIIIRLETRRFKKKGTMIEGLDPKLNNLETVAKDLKNKYACGGTAKEGYIFLQGDHRDTIKDTLVNLGSRPSIIVPFFLNLLVSNLIIILVLSFASSPHAHKSSGRPQVLQITAIRSN